MIKYLKNENNLKNLKYVKYLNYLNYEKVLYQGLREDVGR